MSNKRKALSSVGPIILSVWFMSSSVDAGLEKPSEVDLTINGESITIETTDKTVRRVLSSVDHEYKETDKINYELNDRVTHEMEIVVSSEKEVILSEGGEDSPVKTNASTVRELLEESDIQLKTNDVVIPSMDSKLANEDKVAVIYYKERKHKKISKIDYKVNKEFSSELKYGEVIVKQKGKKGERESIYKEVTRNDVVLSDEKISERVAIKPVTEVIQIGTKELIEESIPNETITKEDSSLYKGESRVIEEGSNGVKIKEYKNDGKKRILVSTNIESKPVNKVVGVGSKDKVLASKSSTSARYTLSQFQHHGVIRTDGRKYTYYSQSVLPGGGLSIPGRHVSAAGYVSDKDGYIVVASNRSIPKGTVIDTPFGSKGKVYDICASCDSKWFDIYTK